jgi:hypothetical protein
MVLEILSVKDGLYFEVAQGFSTRWHYRYCLIQQYLVIILQIIFNNGTTVGFDIT